MWKKLTDRFFIIGLLIAFIFSSMMFQLLDIQIRKGSYYLAQSQERKRKTLPLKGLRGKILDVNGVPLAFDQKSYDVEFFKDPSLNTSADRRRYSQIIYQTIKIIEKNGGKIVASFPIERDKKGDYYFNWGNISEQDAKRRETRWRKDMYIKEGIPPKEVFDLLIDRYQVPEDIPFEDQQAILAVWQDVQFSSYRAYEPVKIARNVNMTTVAEIETHNMELAGMNIAESTTRVYPKGTLAAHIIGYIGKMYFDEEKMKEYEKQGYSRDDMIGREGIEASMESYLTANIKERQGQRIVEVNNRGKITRELAIDPPSSGYNVVLTIDVKLQKKVEEALRNNIELIRNLEEDPATLANQGAAVVLDVKTGEVLAMASNPSYDPNLFVDGLSADEVEMLFNDPRRPMVNYAIGASSRTPGGTPGSIFKMVTGLAGLMEKKTEIDEKIDDQGPYDKYVVTGQAPSCWVRPNFQLHKEQDIVQALKNSCNYYFFEISSRLGIQLLNKWADNLGLTSKTGIELPNEYAGFVGNQEVLRNKTFIPSLVKQEIKRIIKRDAGIDCSDEIVESFIQLEGKEIGAQIREILKDKLNVEDAQKRVNLGIKIASLLTEIQWTPNHTIQTGIGQGVTVVTPLAVSRYIAALVNGGKVYEAHVVKKIVDANGKVIEGKKPTIVNELDIPDIYLEKIKEGMREVVSMEDGGTAGAFFDDFEYKDEIGGKTGTAEVSKTDEEKNNAWFVCFAPYEEPEIVVVVFIPNGRKGAYATFAARDIVQFYMDRKKGKAENFILDANSMIQ
ncbi:MAG: penicillin-binding transpeptidase domain-containing protein [Clostridia bacterium]|jgi:penicillin-binding protein 2